MQTQILKPVAEGALNIDGVEGFYPYPEDTTWPFWKILRRDTHDPVDNEASHLMGWAVESEDPPGVRKSVKLDPLEVQSVHKINYIKCYMIGAGGVDEDHNPITPEGDGNKFSFGLYLPVSDQQIVEEFWFTEGDWVIFEASFMVNPITGEPWTVKEIQGLEWLLSYGRYWITTDKSYTINDNAHNGITSAWVEIAYEYAFAGSASLVLNA